ncbi:MAG: S41 family peptidase [Acidobacteriota bacterium]|nr:S41 family peptidase [Acidobacteriota bacterium]
MKKAQSLFYTIAATIGIFVFSNVIIVAQKTDAPPDMTIDAATRAQVIESLSRNLNKSYVFPEVAKKMETDIRRRMKNKEYDTLASAREFAQKLTDDLRAISKDKHLRVRFSKNLLPVRKNYEEPTAEERVEEESYMRRVNFGFEKIERMPGNIGYIDLRGFMNPKSGAETVQAAMNFLANTDALIFDLRQNGGGDPEMVALISSYLFGDKPVHLNSLYWREGDKTEDFFTKPNLANKKFGDKDIYVLTSNRTFSGAEEFSYNLKNLKRATIIGETTGGGANPGGMFRLTEHFGAFIPTGRAVSPITKTNWEGTGVEPDIKVTKELALKTAYLMALNKCGEKAKDENLKVELKQLIGQTQKEIDELKNKSSK